MRSRHIYNALILCAGLGLVSGTASAAAFSFQGTFSTDDQKEIFSFVAGPGNAILLTLGYAGGTNANGDSISSGGFDPILSLFGPGPLLSSAPLLVINENGDGNVPADPTTLEHFDSYIDTGAAPTNIALIAGETYFLVLTVSPNFPNGPTFGDGFIEDGQGNFTAPYGCASGSFCDVDTNQRDGHWAVDITGVDSAQILTSTPEPGTLCLLSFAGVLALGVRRKFSAAGRAS